MRSTKQNHVLSLWEELRRVVRNMLNHACNYDILGGCLEKGNHPSQPCLFLAKKGDEERDSCLLTTSRVNYTWPRSFGMLIHLHLSTAIFQAPSSTRPPHVQLHRVPSNPPASSGRPDWKMDPHGTAYGTANLALFDQ